MRGGLQLKFKGTGLIIALLGVCPNAAEAFAVALMSRWVFGVPWGLCFASGFTVSAISPAILVPSVLSLTDRKYGTKKGIPTAMLVASSFDDIVSITAFGIAISFAFDGLTGGSIADDIGRIIWKNALYIVTGVVLGAVLGLGLWLVRKANMHVKFIIMVVVAISDPFIAYFANFKESKYVGIISFGYFCSRAWGKDKPDALLAKFWKYCAPLVFSTVGASVQFKDISLNVFGFAILAIFVGLIFRILMVILITGCRGFTFKERLFMAFGWIPKATV